MAIRQAKGRDDSGSATTSHAVCPQASQLIELFDVVAIKRELSGWAGEEGNDVFTAGTEAAVVDIYEFPHRAYCLEVVRDDGSTAGLIDALPEEVRLVHKNRASAEKPPV